MFHSDMNRILQYWNGLSPPVPQRSLLLLWTNIYPTFSSWKLLVTPFWRPLWTSLRLRTLFDPTLRRHSIPTSLSSVFLLCVLSSPWPPDGPLALVCIDALAVKLRPGWWLRLFVKGVIYRRVKPYPLESDCCRPLIFRRHNTPGTGTTPGTGDRLFYYGV